MAGMNKIDESGQTGLPGIVLLSDGLAGPHENRHNLGEH